MIARHTAPGEAPGLWGAYRQWRVAAGSLADYVLPAPFLAPWEPAGSLPTARGATAMAGELSRRAGPGTALILEATPRLGLAVGRRLRASGWTVAPLFGRWPAPRAVLPVERLTGWLARTAEGVAGPLVAPGASPRHLCLLLDAERARRVSERTLRHRFDNRYEYATFLLPPPARLRQWDVARILWAGPAAIVPEDLEAYAEALVDAGIAVELTPLPARPARRRAVASLER